MGDTSILNKQSAGGLLIIISAGFLLYLLCGDQVPANSPPLTLTLGIVLLIGGLIAGLFGSLIGVGGGVILLPILHFWLGYPSPIAVGTSLLIVTFSSASGGYGHLIRKNVNIEAVKWTAPSAIGGVVLGSLLFTLLADDTPVLGLLLGIAFLIPAVLMICESIYPVRFKSSLDKLKINKRYMAAMGLIVGTLAGLLGLGGGYLLVPGLMYLFHLPVILTMGTSLSVVFPVSLIGSIFKLSGGYVDILAALIASAGTVVGAQIGAGSIKHFKPQTLKLAFSIYFFYISIKFITSYI
ncbi:putative membrane protein [hydrocarbon metagenome]|uniref:Putative membrane protein n=1 Tax=hydrocarbon metagenome TaxID=938273 RepID=A0A0W8E5S6_9ZZZZ